MTQPTLPLVLALACASGAPACGDTLGARRDEPTTAASREVAHPAPPESPAEQIDPARSVGTGSCPEGMVSIAGASFSMGSPDGEGERNEHPQHTVTVASFCLDRTEVTAAAYDACADTGLCPRTSATVAHPVYFDDATIAFWSAFCNGGQPERAQHPANCLTASEAESYCRSRHARLPTEAEWELAARGTERRTYAWGEGLDATRLNGLDERGATAHREAGRAVRTELSWDDRHAGTAPVGSYLAGATPEGVLDLTGNVSEWTADPHAPYPGAPDGSPDARRVVRGGSFGDSRAAYFRAAARSPEHAEARSAMLGMRCAR